MPRTTPIAATLQQLIERQASVVTVDQLVANGFCRDAVRRRVSRGRWRLVLPGVVLVRDGEPTAQQRLVAAWLWAGPGAAIDGPTACAWHGYDVPDTRSDQVHVVAPIQSGARSRDFVVVRRSMVEPEVGGRDVVSYVDRPTAVIVAARNARSFRSAIAIFSRALQTRFVTEAQLRDARDRIGDKYCAPVDAALLVVGNGLRSPAELDARTAILRRPELPEPRWNQWVDLGDGGSLLCVDALWPDAGLVHEVNGRAFHAWADQFEVMQARHDRLTAAGLIVLHNSPSRLRRAPDAVAAEIARAYERYAGSGMPAGVRLV